LKQSNWLNRNVIGMSLTSFLSDASHEMATTVLPGFLAVIGVPASVLGLIEGVADAASSFVKLWAGWIADRWGHHKLLTTAGYFLAGISQAVFAFAAGWPLVLAGRTIGWLGRGFKGPIRDAMLADSVEPQVRGKAFGFHRAGDTLGAIVGPIVGVWFLSIWHDTALGDASLPFRRIFLVTLVPGLLAALAFAVMIVRTKQAANHELRFWPTFRNLPNSFRRFLVAVGVFGMGDFAPTLLILAATTLLTPQFGVVHAAQLAGIMYIVRNVAYAAASFPIGALSDRIGRKRMLVAGYSLAVVAMAGFVCAFAFHWASLPFLFLLFLLAGVFIAAEDTLESALTADLIPSGTRSIRMGILGTVNGIGDFGASVLVGLIWTTISPVAAFAYAGLTMLAGTIMVSTL
jgi:MFS family permease